MSEKYRVLQSEGTLYVEGDLPPEFHGERDGAGWRCPLDAQNAAAIRRALPWAAPQPVGLRKSVGCGDRLGIATAGHLRAVCEGDMFPVLAQQSIREMQRANRSAQEVMDDATWGVVEADYHDGWGSDADHLKTIEAVETCVAAGYTGFTLDPGEYVDDTAATPEGKYGRALAHAAALTARIKELMGERPFDLEVSVDETNTPTTPEEHRYIIRELRRLGVPFTGIAPRFVGDFEKGVDYIGSLEKFEESYRQHAAIQRELGPYKLSIHSGSDKFSIYPIIARHSNPFVHLKTAGTSWLEALRVIALRDPKLFRDILEMAIAGYPENRASYHVSAQTGRIPSDLSDDRLPALLEHFDAREVLHVAFGAALAKFRDQLYTVWRANLELYRQFLHTHFRRHILPFSAAPR